MTKDDLKHLHPADVVLWLHVEAAVWRLAEAANIKIYQVRPTKRPKTANYYGLCSWPYHHRSRPAEIFITLRLWGTQRQPLYMLVDVIAHELAHAQVGADADHGPKWLRSYARLLLLADKMQLDVDIAKSGVKLPT